MSVYMTEEEQLDAIKKWWKQYSTFIIVIVSLLMLAIAGYRYWGWHRNQITQHASNTYEHLMLAFSNQDNKKIRSYANELIQEYGNTIYADAARLSLAKFYAGRSNYKKAKNYLVRVAEKSTMPALQQIAKLRLARLLMAEKLYDNALEQLNQVDDTSYLPVINEIKGDAYAAIGRYPQAIASYRKALHQTQTKGVGNLFLEMKTNELAAKTHTLNIEQKSLEAA